MGNVLRNKGIDLQAHLLKVNKSGSISPAQFIRAMKELRCGLTPKEIDSLLEFATLTGSQVKVRPFCKKVKEATEEKPVASKLPQASTLRSGQPMQTKTGFSEFEQSKNEKRAD